MSLDPTPPVPLRPVGGDVFTIPDAEGNATAALLTFVDERPDGRMSHYIQGARMMPRAD